VVSAVLLDTNVVSALRARHRFGRAEAAATAPLWLGRTRGTVDTLMAGTALAHGWTLATRNVADFDDIADLDIINRWELPVSGDTVD
jgi:predicted nucleic acid-binding protein